MNTIRPCGCKGVRTCLQCEKEFNIEKQCLTKELQKLKSYVYCPNCDLLYTGWNTSEVCTQHTHTPAHKGEEGFKVPGIFVKENFLTPEEGATLTESLDDLPWTISQSGRRKQNFGPKTNFKKRKLQLGTFRGFPATTEYLQLRFKKVDVLRDFQTIEQCSLEYEPTKGACIDPHVDDSWIWGERVVTVNCLGDAVLTLTLFEGASAKYNLDLVPHYEERLREPLLGSEELEKFKGCVLRIPMPNLSLIVLYGPARYQFEHAVLRCDVTHRRVCIAYREFTPMYIDGADREKGEEVTTQAQKFWTIQEAT